MTGEVSVALRKSPIASGTPARVIRKLNRPALAMMNMITAEEITDFLKIGYRSLNLISLKIPMPTISA